MNQRQVDAVVVGGGSAGLAAAAEIGRRGHHVAVVEREAYLGGILNQCIHNGFGLHCFNEELTGPEYALRFKEIVEGIPGIELHCSTTVVDVAEEADGKVITAISKRDGVTKFTCRAIVLAVGCWERSRGTMAIPGTRPSGVISAGLAQRVVNFLGGIPGKNIVIVGSGDIGLIMARRMSWVGAKVLGVIERRPYPAGLSRNIAQCLDDFQIPLFLSHAVTEIHGKDRVEAVSVTPIEGSSLNRRKTFRIPCDTLLLSVGLVPDIGLASRLKIDINPETNGPFVDACLMTRRAGVFACGNALFVHDLVDFVSQEATRCGEFVSGYLCGVGGEEQQYPVGPGENVKYVVPTSYIPGRENAFSVRSTIVKSPAELVVVLDGNQVMKLRLSHVQPSEMVNLTLRPAHLKDVRPNHRNELEVSLG